MVNSNFPVKGCMNEKQDKGIKVYVITVICELLLVSGIVYA